MLRCLALLVTLLAALHGADADRILGTWTSADGKARIRISAAQGAYLGTICWLGSPNDDQGKPRVDGLNPDPALRSQAIVGLRILKDLVPSGTGYYDQGWIYDPESGKSYHCHATLSDDSAALALRGYIGISLFGRSETWTRLTAPGK